MAAFLHEMRSHITTNASMDSTERIDLNADGKAEHLCVLVHGLWGSPKHLSYMATALRDRYRDQGIHVLLPKSNEGHRTYDGIEIAGERVTQEIEDALEDLARSGQHITKISMVGYSLGGLVARYAIGLLHSKGYFSKLRPINFTTFATPHLGVRTPALGFISKVWNAFGSRTISTSGAQLFTIDSFRSTNRPLLAVMADPNSIFMHALAAFKHKVLYANIVNDRSAVYYTCAISRYDPFASLEAITPNYLPHYAPVLLDPDNPVSPKPPQDLPSLYSRLLTSTSTLLSRLPIFALLLVLIPLGSLLFIINSAIQSIRSRQRIRLHEAGKAGIGLGSYRIPLLIEDARSAVEGAFDNIHAGHTAEYLPLGGEEESAIQAHQGAQRSSSPARSSSPLPNPRRAASPAPSEKSATDPDTDAGPTAPLTRDHERLQFPTLALTREQFAMIDAMDGVRWRKFPVHIHMVRHSHAAIIVRKDRRDFEEGRVVLGQWVTEVFEI
ncbi:Domain of unknown function DUF676, lipase-like [Lasallia pustulata]|uniref:DUF676 domain-containing protein n=1 Tax=Lasallia pustulata TaxID=136370 RepID=A0A1W5DD86_9LECA|nr:Domain of unknown function DUF676, lipase-like [Lasallia pustulata]